MLIMSPTNYGDAPWPNPEGGEQHEIPNPTDAAQIVTMLADMINRAKMNRGDEVQQQGSPIDALRRELEKAQTDYESLKRRLNSTPEGSELLHTIDLDVARLEGTITTLTALINSLTNPLDKA